MNELDDVCALADNVPCAAMHVMKRACMACAGQAEHWSNTAQNLVATAHVLLDAATMGLQDAAAVASYRCCPFCMHLHTSPHTF
jgi:hypothetical protein